MKKQLLAIALLTTGLANAQVFWSENFNTAVPPALPAGWVQNNVDGLTTSTTAVIAGFSRLLHDQFIRAGGAGRDAQSTGA